MLPELATYFASQGCGTLGVDMFMGKLPDAPDAAAGLFEAPGPAPTIDSSGVAFESPRLLIFIRATAYAEARERAERFYRACLAIRNLTLGSAIYLAATPATPPHLAERDAHRRPVLSLEVNCSKQLSPLS